MAQLELQQTRATAAQADSHAPWDAAAAPGQTDLLSLALDLRRLADHVLTCDGQPKACVRRCVCGGGGGQLPAADATRRILAVVEEARAGEAAADDGDGDMASCALPPGGALCRSSPIATPRCFCAPHASRSQT